MSTPSNNYARTIFLLDLFFKQIEHINANKNGFSFFYNIYLKNKGLLADLRKILAKKSTSQKDVATLISIVTDPSIAALTQRVLHEIDYDDWVEIRANYIEAVKKIQNYALTCNEDQIPPKIEYLDEKKFDKFESNVRHILSIADRTFGLYVHSEDDYIMVETLFDDICRVIRLLSEHKQLGSSLYAWSVYQLARYYEKPIPTWVLDSFDHSASSIHRITDGKDRHKNDLEVAIGLSGRREFSSVHNFQRSFTVFHIIHEYTEVFGRMSQEFKDILIDHFNITTDTLYRWNSQVKKAVLEISKKMPPPSNVKKDYISASKQTKT